MRFFVALLLRMTSKPRFPDGYELVGFSTVACLNPNVAGLVRGKRARARQMRLRTVSVRTKRTSQYVEILTEASTARRWGAMARAQRFLPVWVCNVRVYFINIYDQSLQGLQQLGRYLFRFKIVQGCSGDEFSGLTGNLAQIEHPMPRGEMSSSGPHLFDHVTSALAVKAWSELGIFMVNSKTSLSLNGF